VGCGPWGFKSLRPHEALRQGEPGAGSNPSRVVLVAADASSWAGLAGVALGALLTGGFGLFADWRRRRGDAAMARRLVYADLRTIDRALTDAESNFKRSKEAPPDPKDAGQQWPFGWEREAWSQSWAGYRGLLAANLDDAEFEPLAAAFGFVEQLQNSLAAGQRPFQDADATFLEDVRRAVDGALRTVSPRAPTS
jgi:hypothetical protein